MAVKNIKRHLWVVCIIALLGSTTAAVSQVSKCRETSTDGTDSSETVSLRAACPGGKTYVMGKGCFTSDFNC